MHFRTLTVEEKESLLARFGLVYIPRPFEQETIPEGSSDTKFRFLVRNRGAKEEVVFTIYETPDVHINGRTPEYAEASTLYAAHVGQNLIHTRCRDGKAVNAAIPLPYKTIDTHEPCVRHVCDGVEKLVTVTPFIERAKGSLGTSDCKHAGKALAAMHVAANDFDGGSQPNNFGPGDFQEAYDRLMERREIVVEKLSKNLHMEPEQVDRFLAEVKRTLDKTLSKWAALSPKLKAGWINADYFPDNALLSRDRKLTTVDLGMVCQDTLVYDLAIALNAWSFSGPDFNRAAASQFLVGYNSVREISREEMEALPVAAAVAGLRWTLSRLNSIADDLPARSPVDAFHQARFWNIFADKGGKLDLSKPYLLDRPYNRSCA